MEKFTLINKDRSRIKVFEPFEDVSKPSPSIDAMMISYGCVYKRSSKPVMKGSRVETIEGARKEYKKLLSGTKGSNDVIVTSAFELTDEQLSKITASLKGRYGDSLNIEQVVDISLIGGFSIKCGDEVTDYSIKGKLEKLKNQIK